MRSTTKANPLYHFGQVFKLANEQEPIVVFAVNLQPSAITYYALPLSTTINWCLGTPPNEFKQYDESQLKEATQLGFFNF